MMHEHEERFPLARLFPNDLLVYLFISSVSLAIFSSALYKWGRFQLGHTIFFSVSKHGIKSQMSSFFIISLVCKGLATCSNILNISCLHCKIQHCGAHYVQRQLPSSICRSIKHLPNYFTENQRILFYPL